VNPTYSQVLQPWQGFYSLTGTAAATLMGLLFVSISLSPGVLRGASGNHLRAWAEQTMRSLVSLLLLALTCMMPDLDVPAFAISLIGLGVFGVVAGALYLRMAASDPAEHWQLHHVLIRLVLPVAAHAVLLFVGVNVLLDHARAVDHLIWAVLLFIVGGAMAAWRLLSQLGTAQQQSSTQPSS
jgi:hypothetical protein